MYPSRQANALRTIDTANRLGRSVDPSSGRRAANDSVPRLQLTEQGYVRLSAGDLGEASFVSKAANGLAAATADLPVDPYCPGDIRFRRYARLFILPWNDLITTAPRATNDQGDAVHLYQQPETLNIEEAGVGRWFPAIDDDILASDWMQQIIRFDFALLDFTEAERSGPIQIGVHLVELRPSRDRPAMASPNRVHRDGEHYTCAHLIERSGVVGGENHIVEPQWANHQIDEVPVAAIREAFTLERPLDGYIVRDDRVAHHVAPVLLDPAATKGARKILLIDFTPMRPAMLMDAAST